MIRFIFGVAVGVVTGSVATLIVVNRRYKKKLAAVEDTYKAVSDRKNEKIKMNDEDGVNKTDVDTKAGIQSDSEDEDPEDEQVNRYYEKMARSYSADLPHIITREEYESSEDHFDKHEVMYYPSEERADDITTCSIIQDLDSYLGLDLGCLDDQLFDDSDDGYIYIRNRKYGIDYCVDRAGVGSEIE